MLPDACKSGCPGHFSIAPVCQCVLQRYISDLLGLSIHKVYTPIFWAFMDYIALIENVP